jgi:hypothetical protein
MIKSKKPQVEGMRSIFWGLFHRVVNVEKQLSAGHFNVSRRVDLECSHYGICQVLEVICSFLTSFGHSQLH